MEQAILECGGVVRGCGEESMVLSVRCGEGNVGCGEGSVGFTVGCGERGICRSIAGVICCNVRCPEGGKWYE